LVILVVSLESIVESACTEVALLTRHIAVADCRARRGLKAIIMLILEIIEYSEYPGEHSKSSCAEERGTLLY